MGIMTSLVIFPLALHSIPIEFHLIPCVILTNLTASLHIWKKTPDSKKEEYKRYLEKTGVTDALTKVMVGLYEEPERPPNAIDYIKKYLGAQGGTTEYDLMKKDNDDLKKQIKQLETQIGDMRRQLATNEEDV
jgi:flagellar capping protein FliD